MAVFSMTPIPFPVYISKSIHLPLGLLPSESPKQEGAMQWQTVSELSVCSLGMLDDVFIQGSLHVCFLKMVDNPTFKFNASVQVHSG